MGPSKNFNAISGKEMDHWRKKRRRRVPLRPVASACQSRSRGGLTTATKKMEKGSLTRMEHAFAHENHSHDGPTTATKTSIWQSENFNAISGKEMDRWRKKGRRR